jgi:hypothetical protein
MTVPIVLPLDPPPDPLLAAGVICVALALALWGADNPTPPLPKFIKVFPTTVLVGVVDALVPSSDPSKLSRKDPILSGISSRQSFHDESHSLRNVAINTHIEG